MTNLIKESIIYKKLTSRIYDDGKPLCRHKVEEEEVDAIEIPENATNGDMIKAMFYIPDSEIDKGLSTIYIYTNKRVLKGGSQDLLRKQITFNKDWWDAPYKKGNANG